MAPLAIMVALLMVNPLGIYVLNAPNTAFPGEEIEMKILVQNVAEERIDLPVEVKITTPEFSFSEAWCEYILEPTSFHLNLSPGGTVLLSIRMVFFTPNTYKVHLVYGKHDRVVGSITVYSFEEPLNFTPPPILSIIPLLFYLLVVVSRWAEKHRLSRKF